MKRIIFIPLVALVSLSQLRAQNEEDALRYSRQYLAGTARSIGMGGAMGAIGGDFTTLSINPAGLGLYRGSEFTFSPSLNWNETTSDFLGNKIQQTNYGLKMGNIGYVHTNKTEKEKGIVSSSFGFGYNQLNNFNQRILMSGINTTSSLLDNFTKIYNDPFKDTSPFYEELAREVDMIGLDSMGYFNDFQGKWGQQQKRSVKSSGHIGEYIFSAGTNYSNWIYIGATLGMQRVKFDREIRHTETVPTGSDITFTDEFTFDEFLRTRGYGVNLKIGAIVRPLDFLRLGAAYHTSTLYFLNDRYSTSMTAWALYDPGLEISSKTASSEIGIYDYTLKSPSKFVGSAAVQIGKFGLLSVDYERINYSNAILEGPDYEFIIENSIIKNKYKSANNLRMGGELRLGSGYLRGGYSIFGSPFTTVDPAADAKYSVISGGVGLRTSDFFVDLSYANGMTKEAYYMYIPEMTDGSINKSLYNNMVLTLGFRF